MTDAVDIAGQLEAEFRDEAVREAARRSSCRQHSGMPLAPAGKRACLGCGEVIDPRRIQAEPAAVRCTLCESAQEGRPA